MGVGWQAPVRQTAGSLFRTPKSSLLASEKGLRIAPVSCITCGLHCKSVMIVNYDRKVCSKLGNCDKFYFTFKLPNVSLNFPEV
jgi:hypothetical protein